MMSIVTMKMMISKKSKKVYEYVFKKYLIMYNIYVYKYIIKHIIISNSCKLSEHSISFKKNKMPGY